MGRGHKYLGWHGDGTIDPPFTSFPLTRRQRIHDLLRHYLPYLGNNWNSSTRELEDALQYLATCNDDTKRFRDEDDLSVKHIYSAYCALANAMMRLTIADDVSVQVYEWLRDLVLKANLSYRSNGLTDHGTALTAFRAFASVSRQSSSKALAHALEKFFLDHCRDIIDGESDHGLMLWADAICRSEMSWERSERCLSAMLREIPDLAARVYTLGGKRARAVANALDISRSGSRYDVNRGGRAPRLLRQRDRSYRDFDDLMLNLNERDWENFDRSYTPLNRRRSLEGAREIYNMASRVADDAESLRLNALDLKQSLRHIGK